MLTQFSVNIQIDLYFTSRFSVRLVKYTVFCCIVNKQCVSVKSGVKLIKPIFNEVYFNEIN